MAPQQSPRRHDSAAQRAIALNRFHGIFRTRRHITARRRKRRGYPPFVKSQQPEGERIHLFIAPFFIAPFLIALFFIAPSDLSGFSISFFAITSRARPDRKSTRLNSSHRCISYAVFCLK